MKEVKKPNFFVVGAPKSGTTSLYEYLKQHPQIYLPRIKELNFFCTDLHFRYPLLSEQQFLNYYGDCKNEKAVGEVSVWNLYSGVAAQHIYRFNPQAKIIILLRQPVDMMYALHSNHVFNSNENISDFEEALSAQQERKQGLRISSTIKCPVEGLYYYDIATYSSQVKRYIDIFGEERVKVILFDEFAADAKKVYGDILSFLEVDDFLPQEFNIFNASKTTRSSALKHITLQSPGWLKSIGRWLFPHQTARRDWLMFWLWKINTVEKPRQPLDAALRKRVTEKMTGEIESLQQLLHRDLTHWLR